MRAITTIIFDLCDALVPGKFAGIAEPLADRLGIAREAVEPAFSIPMAKDALLGTVSEEDYLQKVIDLSGWDISVSELGAIIRNLFRQEHPAARALVEELAPHFRMVLISDIWREAAEYIWKMHSFLPSLFTTRIFSFEDSFLKQDADAFRAVLSKHDIDIESSLLIDDSERNTASANSFGLKSIYYQSAPMLRAQLMKMNLLAA